MVEAVRTTASPAGLWVIAILMSLLTGVLVVAPLVADSVQIRVVNRRRRVGELGPAAADAPVAADAPIAATEVTDTPTQPEVAQPGIAQPGIAEAEQIGQHLPGTVPWQRTGGTRYAEASQSDIPTRADLPAQRGGEGDQAVFHQEGRDREERDGDRP
jgi:hypothetical protein